MNHVTHYLSSADISILLTEISKLCYIKKYGYRFHLDTYFLTANFSWVFKDCFNKHGQTFDGVSINDYNRSF